MVWIGAAAKVEPNRSFPLSTLPGTSGSAHAGVRRVCPNGSRASIARAPPAQTAQHDTLEELGWEVLVADAHEVKGLAPLTCKTDRIDALVLAKLSWRDLVPAIWLHQTRAVHRLDHRAHPMPSKTHRQAAQAIGVRRRRGLSDQLAALVEQTDVQSTSTQIQSSVQHERWASSSSLLNSTLSVAPRRPPFIAVQRDSYRRRSRDARFHGKRHSEGSPRRAAVGPFGGSRESGGLCGRMR
jgi:hypothetical protein